MSDLLSGILNGPYSNAINNAALKYGVPQQIIASIIHQESGGNANATNSSSSAIGLMQVTKGAASDVGANWSTLFNAANNIDAGTAYLAKQIKATGNIFDGLAAYNQGLGAYKNSDGVNYAQSVLSRATNDPAMKNNEAAVGANLNSVDSAINSGIDKFFSDLQTSVITGANKYGANIAIGIFAVLVVLMGLYKTAIK